VTKSNIIQDEEQSSATYSARYDEGYYTVTFNTVTFNNVTFTNTYLAPIYLNLKITQTDTEVGLDGALFKLYEYTEGDNTIGNEIGSGKSIDGGLVEFKDTSNKTIQLQRNTAYYLQEMTPPNGYVTAGPWIIDVYDDATATIRKVVDNTSESNMQKSRAIQEQEKPLDSITEDDTNIKLMTMVVNDKLGYQLPSTGGFGSSEFTMGGILLVACAVVLLWYKYTKRGKEDIA
jgi:LPXTG-motif cell wall-anchored protein